MSWKPPPTPPPCLHPSRCVCDMLNVSWIWIWISTHIFQIWWWCSHNNNQCKVSEDHKASIPTQGYQCQVSRSLAGTRFNKGWLETLLSHSKVAHMHRGCSWPSAPLGISMLVKVLWCFWDHVWTKTTARQCEYLPTVPYSTSSASQLKNKKVVGRTDPTKRTQKRAIHTVHSHLQHVALNAHALPPPPRLSSLTTQLSVSF